MRGVRVGLCLIFGALAVSAQAPVSLAALQAEAVAHSPRLAGAQAHWRAAQAGVAPAGTLPDPMLEVQQMSGASPVPIYGYGSNMMSYVGVGASQELPYPGKLRLRAAVAGSQAEALEQEGKAAQRQVQQQVAEAYIALQQARALATVLGQQQQEMAMAEKLAEVHYRTAQGTQADVLAAQLEQTLLLREVASNSAQQAAAQAQLRALLNRPPDAPAIVPEPLLATRLQAGEARLAAALAASPEAAAAQAHIRGAEQATALARKNFEPDFNASFMYQRAPAGVADRAMISVGMTLPFFHRRSRQEPELEQALANQQAATAGRQQVRQQQRYELANALLEAQNDEQILAIDKNGALPQAQAAAQAALTAYGNGQADLDSFLSAWRQGLAIEEQYWTTLAQHETALAAVTALTGVKHE